MFFPDANEAVKKFAFPEDCHPLVGVLYKKSNQMTRPISAFETRKAGRDRIKIIVDVECEEDQYVKVVLNSKIRLRKGVVFASSEQFQFRPDGSCSTRVFADIPGTTREVSHRFAPTTWKRWTRQETLGVNDQLWLRKQLDVIQEWLEDPTTVRLDMFRCSRVLTDEDDAIDLVIAGNPQLKKDLRAGLETAGATFLREEATAFSVQ
jgi:hypothetical protein